MKTKTIPFDLETAKKIQAGEIKGRIMYGKDKAIIVDFFVFANDRQYICARTKGNGGVYRTRLFLKNGNDANDKDGTIFYNLYLEVPDNEPQFKPFDRVLVRGSDKNKWRPRLYSRKGNIGYCTQDGCEYMQILPYEGNEHLVGTTDKPKEE